MEVLSQVILSNDLEFITRQQYENLREDIESISVQLNALCNAAIKKLNP
jgi:four helix bundle protein